jgi:hypothetical protein
MRSQLVDWTLTACDDMRRAVPAPGPESCADAAIPLSPDREVHIILAVADLVRNRRTTQVSWRMKTPVVRDIYIRQIAEPGGGDSLDVPKLSALSALLDVPFAQWPAADFQTDVRWTPQRPRPGDVVRVRFSVRNTGRRYVSRAEVHIILSPCCDETEWRREWFPHLAPGETASLDVSMRLGEGMATALITVKPLQAFKRVRDVNPDRTRLVRWIGYPER